MNRTSPLAMLQIRANKIAAQVKLTATIEKITGPAAAQVAAARERPSVKFATILDDAVINLEMTWAAIRQMSEAELAKLIIARIREDAA